MNDRYYLLTGAAGFLGSNICAQLLAEGKKVRALVLGVVIGMMGAALVAVAYPVFTRVLKKEREKIAPEILRLSDELL